MRVFKAFLCVFLTLSLLTGTMFATSWADEAMEKLLDKKILSSIPEDPDEHISREEFSVMLAKAMLDRDGVFLPDEVPGARKVFADTEDIKPGNLQYIMYLYERGLLTGSLIGGELYMLPDATITRQDAATLIGRWLGWLFGACPACGEAQQGYA